MTICLILFLCGVIVPAEEGQADPLAERPGAEYFDQEAAVARAVAVHPHMRAAAVGLEAATAEAGAGMAIVRPQVESTLSYERVGGMYHPEGFLPGVEDPDDRWFAGVTARQLLWGSGAVAAQRAMARGGIDRAQAGIALTRRDLTRDVRLTVARVWHARERVATARSQVDLVRQQHADAEARQTAGLGDAIDVRQSAIALIQAQERLAVETLVLAQLGDDLAVLLQLDAEAIAITGSLERVADLPAQLAAARAIDGADSGQDLIDATLAVTGAQMHALAAATRPQLHAVAAAGLAGRRPDDVDDGFRVGLELSWRFDGGSSWQRQAAVRAELQAQEWERRLHRDRHRSRVRQLERAVVSLDGRLHDQQTALTLAEDHHRDVGALYAAGRTTLTRVVEARHAIAEARFRIADLLLEEHAIAIELQWLGE